VSDAPSPTESAPVVGIIGGGQLARMMVEASERAGVRCRVLAKPSDESAEHLGADVTLVDAIDAEAVDAFVETVDVLTFDFEPPDLAPYEALEARGFPVRPSTAALRFSDKAHQRVAFAAAGLPVPPFALVRTLAECEAFAAEHAWPVVLKAPRGGYDGRGVVVVDDVADATNVLDGDALWVAEAHLALDAEVAALVVTWPDGTDVELPLVDTVQRDGICVEVRVPSAMPPAVQAEALDVGRRVARLVGAVGNLAVELFVVGGRVLVNEIAPRPHNSGHLTIEACGASQFELHLRAVAGLPPADPALVVPAAVMANVVAADVGAAGFPAVDLPDGAFVHDYGKTRRPDRKVGHVTGIGSDVAAAARLAHAGAEAVEAACADVDHMGGSPR